MRAIIRFILLLCAASLPWTAGGGELLRYDPEHTTPPALSLPDLGGQQHRLEDYRGQVVLVNFWATWCPPCLAEMPSMQRLVEAMAGRPFRILAVNTEETKSKVWKFRKLLNIGFPTLLDSRGEVTRAWEVEVFPTSYLIDAGGHIRYVSYGALEWDDAAVVTVIETLMPDQGAGTTAAAPYVRP
jgi:thiol-disulfide isomerase/thioredoxin